MKKQHGSLSDGALIRQKAENILSIKRAKTSLPVSEADTLKLIHELQVHQIELELQNEELVLAHNKIVDLAKEKYKQLYDFAPSGYLSLSSDGTILQLNFVAAQLLGKERGLLLNNSFAHFVSKDSLSTFNHFLQDIHSGTIKISCEVQLAIKGKGALTVNIDGIADRTNDIFLLTLIDISERKRSELDLLEAKLKAEESDALKSAFLANMSHEIRTPMNGILGFSELLKDLDLESEKRQEYIRTIESGGVRMLNIINDIVDISKIESGQMQPSFSVININGQLKNCFDFFEPEAKQKGIELSFKKTLPDTDAFLKTDEYKFYGILTNLVKNAIKYTKAGKIEFGYRINNTRSALTFYVNDTGIGIPKNRQLAIFERFIQADIENKMAQQGAGLGLAISRAYVEMLKGELWLESEVNVGSTFYFTLPYKTDEMPAPDSAGVMKNRQKLLKPLKVLIVEDDEISKLLLKITLAAFSKEIISVTNGKDAIKACKKNSDIDLVMMDIQLPNSNGYEATREIRKFNKDVIIIAQTAFALTGDREKTITAGCNDYISKPIKKDELESLIHKHLSIQKK